MKNDSPVHQDLCAVVVTFNPDDGVDENLRAMVRECGAVLIVDNGSGEETCRRMATVPGVTLLELRGNLGIAAALNRGIAWAAARNYAWVVTFDQDSQPHPGFGAALLTTRDRMAGVAMVGPYVEEEASSGKARWLRVHPRTKFLFQAVPCRNEDLSDVTVILTSGALTSVATWQMLGGFDEALFIDYVDTDFCLRVLTTGQRIGVSAGARLRHHLGKREKRVLAGRAFYPTHHSALRNYYIARNRWPMLRRHAWRHPHWLGFEILAATMWTFRVLVFEHQRPAKFKAMFWGTWDGLRGCGGPCPEHRLRALQR